MSRGFTLIELLVAMVITVIAGGLILGIFVHSDQTFHLQNNKVSQDLSSADSLKAINDLIRISHAVATNFIDGPTTYTSGQKVLVLSLPSLDANGNNMTTSFDNSVITADSSNPKILRLRTIPTSGSHRPAQNRVLSTNLAKITFLYYDSNNQVVSPPLSLRVNVTINTSEPAAISSVASASSDVNLRND